MALGPVSAHAALAQPAATIVYVPCSATALATANRLAETAASVLPNVRVPAFVAKATAPKRRKPAKSRAVKARATKTIRRIKRTGRKSK